MALKDLAVRSAKPRERAYKLSDGGGLARDITGIFPIFFGFSRGCYRAFVRSKAGKPISSFGITMAAELSTVALGNSRRTGALDNTTP